MERITDRRFKRLQFFQIFRQSDLYRDTSVPGNLASLRSFRLQVIRRWLRALQRRSQKDRMTWPRLVAIAERWLPKPRILHPYPTDRGDGGNVGIIRSPLRVTVLPDCGGASGQPVSLPRPESPQDFGATPSCALPRNVQVTLKPATLRLTP